MLADKPTMKLLLLKHAVLLSPVGKLEISGCETGLHEIKLPKMSVLRGGDDGAVEAVHGLAAAPTSASQRGQEQLPVPPFHHPLLQQDSFTKQVLWTLLRDVKFGEAISYQKLADLAGQQSNPIPIIIPCHRVIRSSGQTGNYGGGNLMKEWLLSHEKLQKEKLRPSKEASGSPRGQPAPPCSCPAWRACPPASPGARTPLLSLMFALLKCCFT
uniref:Methylated-DNA--protein-cysteine methyltransferase n=1 Tax=Anas platyrhynchos TaxID=8839 RepID=A0A8B9TQZ7_ANAPL